MVQSIVQVEDLGCMYHWDNGDGDLLQGGRLILFTASIRGDSR